MVRIEPWEIGVRRSLTGGITERDFDFGYQLRLPFLHSYYRLPRTPAVPRLPESGDPANKVRSRFERAATTSSSSTSRCRGGSRTARPGRSSVRASSTPIRPRSSPRPPASLRRVLAQMTNLNDLRLRPANEGRSVDHPGPQQGACEQYHVVAEQVVIRAIRFRKEYEVQAAKQTAVHRGKVSSTKPSARSPSPSKTPKPSRRPSIRKCRSSEKSGTRRSRSSALSSSCRSPPWRPKRCNTIERSAPKPTRFTPKRRPIGDLAEAKAEALGEKLKAAALASRAGRTYSAITAAENFKLGEIQLNSNDPTFMQRFGSMKAWRQFFLGQ